MDSATQPSLACFAPDYFAARERFLSLARARGATLASYPIGARGPGGEPLTIDTALVGAREPRRLLLISSGTHGVEGFAGSALQQQWLERAPALPADGACLLIHAINPYGFAWRRRTNEHNVDLNRNGLDEFPGPPNPAYRRLDAWLNPASAPPAFDFFLLRGGWLLLRHGFTALERAVVGGQYAFPRGLFYGGDRREASVAHIAGILDQPAFAHVAQVLALDLHTGVGRFGEYEIRVDVAEDSPAYRDYERWFGAETVGSSRGPESTVYPVSGGLNEFLERRVGAERTRAAVLEIGTVPPIRLLALLRRENRAYHYTAPGSPARTRAAAALHEAFCPSGADWRPRVLAIGSRVLAQAERALFGAPTAV